MSKRPPRNGETRVSTQNTLLVDGNALFKNGFFGAKGSYNTNGVHVGGLYQFLMSLRKLLKEDLYHRVYVFWDGNFSGKLRYEIYNPYKSDRGKDYINGTQPIDESELRQRILVWEYLNEMYIRQLKHEVIESDDFIAYYCLRKKENEKITICTNDRDLSQLISEDVKIYFVDLKKYVDITNYSSYFKHAQSNSVLVKTIAGDDSDSIYGVKGVKEPTLLKFFPELKERKVTINEIIESATKQQKERVANKKKPLVSLNNIINKVTDGVQGDRLFEINERLVDLSIPFMTDDGIDELEELIDGTLDSTGRQLKNVIVMMKRDGLDEMINKALYEDFLTPFKKLIGRE